MDLAQLLHFGTFLSFDHSSSELNPLCCSENNRDYADYTDETAWKIGVIGEISV